MVVLVLYGSSVSVWSPMASTTSLAASAEPEAASAARPSSADAQRMEKEDCFMEELQSVRGKNAGGLRLKNGSESESAADGMPCHEVARGDLHQRQHAGLVGHGAGRAGNLAFGQGGRLVAA